MPAVADARHAGMNGKEGPSTLFSAEPEPHREHLVTNADATTSLDAQTDSGRPAELFQLDESTCVALLGVHHVGRLIIPGSDPYVIPVNYTALAGEVVFRTERRPVIDAVIDRPVVFEVDMFDDRTRSGWSVVVRGRTRHHLRHRHQRRGHRLRTPLVGARQAGLRRPYH